MLLDILQQLLLAIMRMAVPSLAPFELPQFVLLRLLKVLEAPVCAYMSVGDLLALDVRQGTAYRKSRRWREQESQVLFPIECELFFGISNALKFESFRGRIRFDVRLSGGCFQLAQAIEAAHGRPERLGVRPTFVRAFMPDSIPELGEGSVQLPSRLSRSGRQHQAFMVL